MVSSEIDATFTKGWKICNLHTRERKTPQDRNEYMKAYMKTYYYITTKKTEDLCL